MHDVVYAPMNKLEAQTVIDGLRKVQAAGEAVVELFGDDVSPPLLSGTISTEVTGTQGTIC